MRADEGECVVGKSVKFAIIGAGSICFSPPTLADILRNKRFSELDRVNIYLMDISQEALDISSAFCRRMVDKLDRKNVNIESGTHLAKALAGADFVITAIEVDRYHYWSMDFHIPRRYGFRQIYGENGGPGGMFHTLRNLPPMLEIAHTMEKECPDAWLLNYTNPETKLVEGLLRFSKVNVVGLCHGVEMGKEAVAQFMNMPKERIEVKAVGLNHFGWFTRLWDKKTGEDLYPRLKELERDMDWLAHWDEHALPRIMLRTYGLWSYPGTNHVGEYIAWSDEMLASTKMQFFFDAASERPWETRKTPEFVYSLSSNPTGRQLFNKENKLDGDPGYLQSFGADVEDYNYADEYGIPIAESIFFDIPYEFSALNLPNHGYAKDLPDGMVIELPAKTDGKGIHAQYSDPLPTAVAAMISTQGAIHKLVLDAYEERSRNKLLQAMLLDPTISTYNNAVALIDEMCERQKEVLPELHW